MSKARKQGSNSKGKCNCPIFSPTCIFSTLLGYNVIHALNVGLLHFTLLLDLCFHVFYTTIAFKSYTTNFLIENVFSYLYTLECHQKSTTNKVTRRYAVHVRVTPCACVSVLLKKVLSVLMYST